MLENLFAKANKYLSQAETLFSGIIPTQICVDFTNPIVQQTQQRVVCDQTGLSLRQLSLLYLNNRRTLKLLWNGSQEVLPSIKHKQIYSVHQEETQTNWQFPGLLIGRLQFFKMIRTSCFILPRKQKNSAQSETEAKQRQSPIQQAEIFRVRQPCKLIS